MRKGEFGNGYIKIFAPWYKFPRCWTALELEKLPNPCAQLSEGWRRESNCVWDDLKLSPEQIKWYHLVLRSRSAAATR